MTFCESAGAWAADFALGDAPERVRERARLQTSAILAAGHAGAAAAAPMAAVAPEGPLGEVYAGAAASIAHDWDDYLFMGHTGHSSVWVSRALAGEPDTALRAQIAGNEVGGRLGAALLLGPHNGQFWSAIHCASAAAAAGVSLGLDAGPLSHALAIALYQPPYGLWPGFMGPPTKLLTAADPAVQGARAALLAAEGVRGALDVVESPRGLLRHFAFAPRPRMLGHLGEVWLTDTLAFKPAPGCAYLQSAVAAVLESGVEADEVAGIEIDAGYLTLAMEELGAAAGLTPVGVTFSTARSVAVALLAGRLTHEELDPSWLARHEAAIHDLAARVELHHDWQLTLATVRGTVRAGATLRDVPIRTLPGVVRRLRALGGPAPPWRGAEALLLDRRLRRQARELLRRPAGAGLGALDTEALRLTFPARLRIRLRSGRQLEIEGAEHGACGHPVAEQRAVVDAKARAVGLIGAMSAS